jgi:hypothetical protein
MSTRRQRGRTVFATDDPQRAVDHSGEKGLVHAGAIIAPTHTPDGGESWHMIIYHVCASWIFFYIQYVTWIVFL